MRRTGWIVTILGALLVVLGLAVAVVLGPDSRFTTGPHPIDTSGTVVVTEPGAISWTGVQVDVLAEVPVNKPVFVGLGNSVDVEDYVQRTQRLEVTSFSTPWEVESGVVEGQEGLPGAPTALDWWIADSAGLGGASISTTLPDETVSLAIVAVGATNLSGLEVTLAYGVKGGFAAGVGTALLGAGLVLAGHSLRRGRGLFAETDDEGVEVVEEVVYVYVDEDGIEHEITAEEAAELEAAQDEDPAGPDDSAVDATDEPDVTAPAGHTQDLPGRESPYDVRDQQRLPPVAGVVTAADILREAGLDPSDVATTDRESGLGEDEATQPEAGTSATVEPAEDVSPEQEGAVPGEPGVEPVRDPEDLVTEKSSTEKPGAEKPGAGKVVYVFVDEDGVEHEVSEDELDDYEVVDDEEGDS